MVFSISAPRIERPQLEEELNNLSRAEREAVQRDLYGTREEWEEDETELRMMIQDVKDAAGQLDESNAEYLEAVERCPEYVHSDDFLAMFLRADNYNVESAAKRLTLYWKEKLRVFGTEKTYRRLSLGDLEDRDIEVIRISGLIPLPSKDCHGRGIFSMVRTKWNNNRDSMSRVQFYVWHCMIDDDIEVQRKGAIMIMELPFVLELKDFDRKTSNKFTKNYRNALPVYIAGIHVVNRSALLDLIMPYVLFAMGKHFRARVLTHRGTKQEIREKLAEYGISESSLPPSIGGTLEMEMDRWLEERRASESRRRSTSHLCTP